MKTLVIIFLCILPSFLAFSQTMDEVAGTLMESVNTIGGLPVESINKVGGVASPSLFKSCKEIKDANPEAVDGIYTIDPDGEGGMDSFDCYCDMTTDGGGWTLVSVHSDDGEANWTYSNRDLYYNETFIGNLNQLHLDYKGEAMVRLRFYDVMAVHAPSGVWAAYHNVGNGSLSLGQHISSIPFPNCQTTPGNSMSAGSLTLSGTFLCNTDLFFNVGDWEGQNQTNCMDFSGNFNNATYGPVWSVDNNSGCPFDDPGTYSGLGVDLQVIDTERLSIGFGWAIGGNTGTTGTGANHMKIFIR